MKTGRWILISAFVLFLFAGCEMPDDPYSEDDTADYLPDDPPVDTPPDYAPPSCVVAGTEDGYIYDSHEEFVQFTVSVQNISKDETAYNVQCQVELKSGEATAETVSLGFDDVAPQRTATISSQCTVYRPTGKITSMHCVVDWQDASGNCYQSDRTVQFYL